MHKRSQTQRRPARPDIHYYSVHKTMFVLSWSCLVFEFAFLTCCVLSCLILSLSCLYCSGIYLISCCLAIWRRIYRNGRALLNTKKRARIYHMYPTRCALAGCTVEHCTHRKRDAECECGREHMLEECGNERCREKNTCNPCKRGRALLNTKKRAREASLAVDDLIESGVMGKPPQKIRAVQHKYPTRCALAGCTVEHCTHCKCDAQCGICWESVETTDTEILIPATHAKMVVSSLTRRSVHGKRLPLAVDDLIESGVRQPPRNSKTSCSSTQVSDPVCARRLYRGARSRSSTQV